MNPLHPLAITSLVGVLLFASLVPLAIATGERAKNRTRLNLLAITGSIILSLSILVLFALSYSHMVSAEATVTQTHKQISGAFSANFSSLRSDTCSITG